MKSRVPLYKRRWSTLTPRQKAQREQALQVLSEMRKANKSLKQTSYQVGITAHSVIRNTNALRKDLSGKWRAKKYDRISRVMKINEKGKEVSIDINDSRTASLIGKYQSAVGQFLNSGNLAALKRFHGRGIRDIDGNYHILECYPKALKAIHEKIEEPEFYEVYSS